MLGEDIFFHLFGGVVIQAIRFEKRAED